MDRDGRSAWPLGMMNLSSPRIRFGYGIAIIVVGLAVLARLAMEPWWGSKLPFITLFPAVLVSAWIGGLGPGLLATGLGGLVAAYLWLVPARSFRVGDPAEAVALAVYVAIGVVMSVVVARLRRAQEAVEETLAREQAARRNAEAGYEASRRLAAIIEGSQEAIVGKTLDGIVTSWNRAAERMFGFAAEEAVGSSIRIIIPEDRLTEEETILSRLRRGETVALETVRRRKDGTLVTVALTASPIRNSAGTIVGAAKIARDVTQQKRIDAERAELLARAQVARQEAEAAEQHARFLAEAGRLLASSLDHEATLAKVVHLAVPRLADMAAVDLLDEHGQVRRVAAAHLDAARERFLLDLRNDHGFRADAGSGVPSVIRSRKPVLVATVSDEELVAAATSQAQLDAFRALGMRSWIIVPLVARDSVLGALTFVMTDSGRRYSEHDLRLAEALADRAASAIENARLYRRAEAARSEAELASRAKDDFLATLSHELRTPLTAVYGWARILETLPDDATRAKAVDVILRNARLQVQMIDELLDVSRIVTGKMRLDVGPVDLRAVVEAAVDVVRPAADGKAIGLRAALDLRAVPVLGDADRLQQIAWNLLINAVKFTGRGGHVEVTLRRVDTHVELRVSDNGQGIASDELPYIFDRFRQGESGSARSHGGLGIGLALVRHLVELHGGGVRAESAGRGKGATFIVTLPLAAGHLPGDSGRPAAAPAVGPGRELAGLRVVVVDDDADGLELIRTILTAAGASVTACASAGAAFARIAEFRPDLLVSDIEMPGEDGYALIRRVRALSQDRGHLPAVAVTAYGRLEDRMRAFAAGFTAHLAKPIDPTDLVAIVAAAAGRARATVTG
jgi:PAS domain S-box-containing protein